MKRKLNLLELTLMGVGLTIGAGVYALIGEVAVISQGGLPLSMLIAGIAAACSGVTLAELAFNYPLDASIYEYCKKAFNNDFLGFLSAWALIFVAVVLASTVSLGFGQYLTQFIQIPEVAAGIGIIILVSLINILGVEITTIANAAITILEVLGLVAILYFSLGKPLPQVVIPNLGSIMSGAALAFFAFAGFEAIITAVEEAEKPKSDIPEAIILSLAICTILYILVSFSILRISDPAEFRKAPLATAAAKAAGPIAGLVISIIALLSTSNTVLLSLYEASRLIYGMAEEKAASKLLLKMNRFEVPQNAILVAMALAFVFSFTGILFAAEVTNALLLFVLIISNLSLVVLRTRSTYSKPPFPVPSLFNMPITAILGLASSILLLAYIQADQLIASAGVLLFGCILYGVKFVWEKLTK